MSTLAERRERQNFGSAGLGQVGALRMFAVFHVADGKYFLVSEIADCGDGLVGPHGGARRCDQRGVVAMNAGDFAAARVMGLGVRAGVVG